MLPKAWLKPCTKSSVCQVLLYTVFIAEFDWTCGLLSRTWCFIMKAVEVPVETVIVLMLDEGVFISGAIAWCLSHSLVSGLGFLELR